MSEKHLRKSEREIRLSISEALYRELVQRAYSENFKSVEEYIISLIQSHLERTTSIEKPSEDLVRLERKLMDLVNRYTSKVDELAQRISELRDMIDGLSDRYNDLDNRYNELRRLIDSIYQSGRGVQRREKTEAREEPHKKTAIEVLKDQKIIFESSVVSKIRDRDSFFRRLESDGAKIIKLSSERVAVDPDFWSEFMRKIENIKEDSEEAIRKALSRDEYKLFERLKKDGLIAYSTIERKWILVEE
ncbi:MAG: hypothetical protein QXE13_04915 [Sulfolobales archaeon]